MLREVDHVRQGAGEPARRWFAHRAADAGDDVGVAHKTSPVLVGDGALELPRVRREFGEERAELSIDIAAFVADALGRHPDAPPTSRSA